MTKDEKVGKELVSDANEVQSSLAKPGLSTCTQKAEYDWNEEEAAI